MQNQPLIASGLPLPDLFPTNAMVHIRPPPIPITIIKRTNTRRDGNNPSQSKKDVHRWVKAVADVGKYVREHNDTHKENQQLQYRWYDASLSDNDVQKTLYRIVDDKAREHIGSLYGRYTYNEAQIRHPRDMEKFVCEVAKDPMFDPLTQTAGLFGVRSVIETKMTTKRRCRKQKERREAQRSQQPSESASVPQPSTIHRESQLSSVPSATVIDQDSKINETEPKPADQQEPLIAENPVFITEEVPVAHALAMNQESQGVSGIPVEQNPLHPETQLRTSFGAPQSVINDNAVSVVADLPQALESKSHHRKITPVDTDPNAKIVDTVSSGINETKEVVSHPHYAICSPNDNCIDPNPEESSESFEDTEAAISELEKKLKQLKKKRKSQAIKDSSKKGSKKQKKASRIDNGSQTKGSASDAGGSAQQTKGGESRTKSQKRIKSESTGPPRSGLSRKGRKARVHPAHQTKQMS